MGLGKPVPGEVESLPTSLYKSAKIEHHMFALCLGHNGGHFTIGNYDGSLNYEEPLFIPYSGSALFTLKLESLVIWDTAIDITGGYGNAVVDSGTTIVQLPA